MGILHKVINTSLIAGVAYVSYKVYNKYKSNHTELDSDVAIEASEEVTAEPINNVVNENESLSKTIAVVEDTIKTDDTKSDEAIIKNIDDATGEALVMELLHRFECKQYDTDPKIEEGAFPKLTTRELQQMVYEKYGDELAVVLFKINNKRQAMKAENQSETQSVEPEESIANPTNLDETILKNEYVKELIRRRQCIKDGIDPLNGSPFKAVKSHTLRKIIKEEFGEDILLTVENLC